uniref:protein-tyrosine-phosphatase n=1 Tax=Gasterosteus aculeatus aculeatus TaxID=481459 RepID=A0AAQ4QI50_GASAC
MPGPSPWPSPPSSSPEHTGPSACRVTDYIYVGNLNAAYNGLIPCTCSRGARHSWSRLKVDIGDVPDALGDGPSLKQRCFEDINGCIDASTEKRKRVLVHCRDGFSLAPTCIIQYLMVKQNMRLIAAYELLRAKYPINIREGHQDMLVSLERALRPGAAVVINIYMLRIWNLAPFWGTNN